MSIDGVSIRGFRGQGQQQVCTQSAGQWSLLELTHEQRISKNETQTIKTLVV